MLTSLYRLCFTCLILILAGCTTEDTGGSDNPDNPDNPSTPITGIAVKTSEIITIELEAAVNQVEYNASFGDKNIKVSRIDNSQIMFIVPFDMDSGIVQLEIPALDISAYYDVSQQELNATPEEVINQLMGTVNNEITGFGNDPETTYVKDYWIQVEEALQNASAEDKLKAAHFYQANKQMIDDYLTDDFTRQSESDLSILSKHKIAVAAFGAGVAVAILSPDPITKAFAAGVAIIAWKKAKGYLSYLAEKKLKKINFIIDDLESELSRQQAQRLEFTHDVSKTLNLNVKQRTISSEDQNDGNVNVGIFFEGFNLFNEIVEKLNNVIAYVNENLFFSNIDQVADASLIEDSPNRVSVDSGIYENMDFSVDSDKVEIVENTYQDGLKLTFKIKDVENLNQDYIDTKLSYSYTDDFNDFSGSFDIRVNKEKEFVYEGWWLMTSYNENGTVSQYDKLKFDEDGYAYAGEGEFNIPDNDDNWYQNGYDWSMLYNTEDLRLFVLSVVYIFEVNNIDAELFEGYIYSPYYPDRKITLERM